MAALVQTSIVAMALLAACARSSPAPPPATFPVAVTAARPLSAPARVPLDAGPSHYVPADAEAHAALLASWDEEKALSNPLEMEMASLPVPHPRWVKTMGSKAAPFAANVEYRVAGYTYNWGNFQGSCGAHILEKDGSLCGSTQRKSYPLPPELVQELVRLADVATLPEQPNQRVTSRCDFDPHHAFVVTAKDGSLVRTLEVCFECGEMRMVPSATGKAPEPETINPASYERFRVLCRAAGMPGCPADVQMKKRIEADFQAFRMTDDARSRFDRWPDPGNPVVDPRVAMRDLDDEERRRMCLWFGQKLAHPGEHGFECPNGQNFQTLGFGNCFADFPTGGVSGAATVGETLACFGNGAYDPESMCEPMHGRTSTHCADVIEDGLGIAPSSWHGPVELR